MKIHALPIDALCSCERFFSPFLLFDTAHCSAKQNRSYLFVNPQRIIRAQYQSEVEAALLEASRSSYGAWVAGYLCYEASHALRQRQPGTTPPKAATDTPLVWFGVFDRPYIFDHITGHWDRELPQYRRTASEEIETSTAPFSSLTSTINFSRYRRAIGAIKRMIAAGETYQVNFTYDVLAKSEQPPFDVYRSVRRTQPTPYCAYIRTAEICIASFSPELFFTISNRTIRVRPMKGTAARGRSTSEDAARLAWLASDPKNRSENVMIVDMMRNDLGRICTVGSVVTERLFQVESHPTVLQMTSTISGTLRHGVDFSEIIRSLFPSGSVTGAPKIRTMEIIHKLEDGPRGPYCGAIGFIAPRMRKAIFSVPIRTLVKYPKEAVWHFRVGSGIVWDSKARTEWDECSTKCAFLTRPTPKFEIFESMLWRNGRIIFWKDHVERLRWSANYFCYPFENEKLQKVMAEIQNWACRRWVCAKVRIFLSVSGHLRWDATSLDPPPPRSLTVVPSFTKKTATVFLASQRIDPSNSMLFHKTTYRPWYEDAVRRIQRGECFDLIFSNLRGEITEGARSNVFIQRQGVLFTPALRCGVLPGILRQRLLRSGRCREDVLTLHDLQSAEAIFCGNSVRGLVRITIANASSLSH